MIRDSDRRGLALLLLPYLAGVAILIVLPGLATFWLSLYEYDLVRPPAFTGLRNFADLMNDEVFRISLTNSLSFVLFAVPLRLLAALSLALLLHRRVRGAGAYRSSVYLPTVIPDVAYALLWLWIFNPLYGPLNLALGALGVDPPQWLTDPDAARSAIVVMSVFTIGEGFLVAMAARNQVPEELYEVAEVEDAGMLNRLGRITLPLMGPALLLLFFRDVIFSLQATFVPALVLTQGGPPPYATTYLPLFVYRNGFEYLRYGYASAATVAMFTLTGGIILIQYLIVRRWRRALAVSAWS